jgi:cytochrome c-type biogenesis protein CcmE
MLIQRKRRLYFIITLLIGVSAAVGLALFALRQNVNLYQTPRQVAEHPLPKDQIFRLGGMVVKGSVQQGADLQVSFTLTDYHANVRVQYQGVLPSLFREGQGIVAQGRLDDQGVFIAEQVLAKHDANYKPPAINEAAVKPSESSASAAKLLSRQNLA